MTIGFQIDYSRRVEAFKRTVRSQGAFRICYGERSLSGTRKGERDGAAEAYCLEAVWKRAVGRFAPPEDACLGELAKIRLQPGRRAAGVGTNRRSPHYASAEAAYVIARAAGPARSPVGRVWRPGPAARDRRNGHSIILRRSGDAGAAMMPPGYDAGPYPPSGISPARLYHNPVAVRAANDRIGNGLKSRTFCKALCSAA